MEIEPLLNDFAAKRWDRHPFERLIEFVTTAPSELSSFVEAAVTRVHEGGTFLDLTFSFLSPQEFERLVALAIRLLSSGNENGAANSVIAYASLQFPSLLHPYLSAIFALRPNNRTYYENWPWRESESLACAELTAMIRSQAADDIKLKAWRCLLETRYGPALVEAMACAKGLPLEHPTRYFLEVGFESPTAPLFDAAPRHIVFPAGYFTKARPASIDRSIHPTWNLSGEDVECIFGGHLPGQCGLCGGRLHRLISLPEGAAPCRTPLTLATCLSCLGWERPFLAYRHGLEGLPTPLERGEVLPQFPAVAIMEATVRVVRTPSRWRWQDWALSNSRENLSRIGGHPSWIQSAEYPKCPSCGTTMRFLAQFDSDLPTEDQGEWLWGSGGICYGFWCESCRVSGFLWQCT